MNFLKKFYKLCFIIGLFVLGIFIITMVFGTKYKTITFNVETGDSVLIGIEENKGYDLSYPDKILTISKNGNTISQGTFINIEDYNHYVNLIENDTNNKSTKIIKKGSNSDIEYLFYSFSGENHNEWNYVIKIKGTNTGILIGNLHSQKEAEECFEMLKIEEK